MITQELLTYIRQQLSLGTDREKIRKQLLSGGGWKAQEVDGAFELIEAGKPKPAPAITPAPTAPKKWKRFVSVMVIVILSLVALFLAWKVLELKVLKKQVKTRPSEVPQITYNSYRPAETVKFIPEGAELGKEINIDLDGDRVAETAFSYRYQTVSGDYFDKGNSGVRVLKHDQIRGWSIAYEMKTVTGNGDGVWSAPEIGKVLESGKEMNGRKEALLVVTEVSGAGVASFWTLVVADNGTIKDIDTSVVRKKALDTTGYMDWGYNSIRVSDSGYQVIETLPGYSKTSARCCPDKPAAEASFSFIGNQIKLDEVKVLTSSRPR